MKRKVLKALAVKTKRDLNFWPLGSMLAMAGDYIDGSTKKIFANDTKEGWRSIYAESFIIVDLFRFQTSQADFRKLDLFTWRLLDSCVMG